MGNTCGIALGVDEQQPNGRVICEKPAVDWADVSTPSGGWVRVYLCADHLYHREMILAVHGSAPLPFDPFEEAND